MNNDLDQFHMALFGLTFNRESSYTWSDKPLGCLWAPQPLKQNVRFLRLGYGHVHFESD